MFDKKKLSGLILCGLTGGVFAGIILSSMLKSIGEYTSISMFYLILLFLLITIFSSLLIKLKPIFSLKMHRIIKSDLRKSVIFTLFLCFILYGLYISSENILISWILLIAVYGLNIWLGFNLFSSKENNFKGKTLSLIGGIVGGILGGIAISLFCALTINFSIDEGYFILLAFILALNGAIAGGIFWIYYVIFEKDNQKNILQSGRASIAISYSMVFIILISITAYNYWGVLDLNSSPNLPTDRNNLFDCKYDNYGTEPKGNISSKEQIIDYLKTRIGGNFLRAGEKSIDNFAVLYLLSGNETWANEFKKKLVEEANNNRFTGISDSVKAWQYEVMVRGYYYDKLSRADSNLFNDSENELILGWFNKLNERAFKVIWVDYIYDSIFKKIPDGLYENQEIGIGMLSVLSDVLENKYPEISKKDKEYIDKYGVGWKGNFRNPDDGIVYHQQFWIKNAYMMAQYGGQEHYINSSNARNSFDWVLYQWPPNGMSPAYNSPYTHTPFDIMVLGAKLFHDGNYSWLANSMLKNEMENPARNIDPIIGLEYWGNVSTPVVPNVMSCYIRGTTGIAPKPGPIQPDKIVLREGWKEDSLYALLNLRFSGWHSYKATNSFTSVMYGEPFIVEKLELRNHTWLPRGKADHRDKKIDRTELNGFQIETNGLQKIIYQITGIGSPWAQDPPRFAEVLAFNSTPLADYSISRISNWHGWDNTRTSVLVKGNDSFLVVFDQNKGKSPSKVAVNWHLKGDAEISDQLIKLSNNNYSMKVHFPHLEDDFRVEIQPTEYLDPPAGEIHRSDYDFFMISENKTEAGFLTLFYPNNGNLSYQINKIDIKNSNNESVQSKALGVSITNLDDIFIIGQGNGRDEYSYGEIETNAEFFVMRKNNSVIDVSFRNVTLFKIIYDHSPLYIEQNGNKLLEDQEWKYFDGKIIINPNIYQGYISLKI